MRKMMLIFAVLAAAAVGLAACGGDDDSGAGTDSAATETPAADAGSDGASGSQTQVSANSDGRLEYEQSSLSAGSNMVEVAFTNSSAVPHDVRVEDGSGTDLGGTEVFTEGEQTASLDLEPGEYTFFCSVGGHRAAGMEGTLTVE